MMSSLLSNRFAIAHPPQFPPPKMPSASAFVVWDAIRKFDSHAVRLGGKKFSTDKLNLTNVHSFSASGLAQPRALGIHAVPKKGGNPKEPANLVLTTKSAKVDKTKTKAGKKKGVKAGKTKSTSSTILGVRPPRARARARPREHARVFYRSPAAFRLRARESIASRPSAPPLPPRRLARRRPSSSRC